MSFRNPSDYTINMMKSSQSNFDRAFTPNKNLIPQRDTTNYGNIIHNNVNNNVLSEIVTEYTVHIDSKDRDVAVYPNPYNFITFLGGPATRVVRGETISGLPDPRIDVNFKNVKYIKLKYIMLPRNINYFVSEDSDGNKTYTVSMNNATILSTYRYLLLRIKDISNDKFFSTSNVVKNECFVIYRDSNYSDAINDLWFATQPIKIYYDNGLKNLSRLSIEILTPDGDQLKLYSGSYATPIPYDEINEDNSESDPSSDFYTLFNKAVQTSMEFEIGVCENQINSQKNYR